LGGKENIILGIFPLPNLSFMYGVGAEKVSFKWADWDISKVYNYFKAHAMDLLGFYHSHASGDLPIPSHLDVLTHQKFHLKVMMIISLANLKSTKVAAFSPLPQLTREKLTVIKDGAIDKYLLELDIKKSARQYLEEEEKLEKRVNEIISEVIEKYKEGK